MKKLLLLLLLATFAATEINSQTVVELTEAGTLQEKVPDYSNVTSLVVSGPINGTDLRYIREMAGIKVSGGPSQGKLSELDLSDARIVAGGDYYMYDYSSYEEFYTANDETRTKRILQLPGTGVYHAAEHTEENRRIGIQLKRSPAQDFSARNQRIFL